MFKKCLLWIIPLLLLGGSHAAGNLGRQASGAPAGVYQGEIPVTDKPTMNVTITLSATKNPEQMLISGRGIRQDFPPVEFRGTYYVKRNRFAAFGEVRGSEDMVNVTLDGKWTGSEFALTYKGVVVGSGLNYSTDVSLRPGASSGLTPTAEIRIMPNKAVSGQPITGKATISITNIPVPSNFRVSGFVASSTGTGMERTNGNGLPMTIQQAGVPIEIDLAKLGLTAPQSSAKDSIGVTVALDSNNFVETAPLEISSASGGFVEIGKMKVAYSPSRPTPGTRTAFSFNYMVQNLRSIKTEFTITEKIRFQKGGGPVIEGPSKEWSGSVDSYLSTSKSADLGPLEIVFPEAGEYRVEYEVTGNGVNQYRGSVNVTVDPAGSTGGGGQTVTGGGGGTTTGGGIEPDGSINGGLTLSPQTIKSGGSVSLTVSYTLSGRSDADVNEIVNLVGPSGSVVTGLIKDRTIHGGEENKRRFLIDAVEPGAYAIRVQVKGERTNVFRTEGAFTVEGKPAGDGGTAGGGGKPDGTYGLVKKEIGQAPPPGQGPYNTLSGTITESSVDILWTATRDYEGTFTFKASLSTPPAVLKPGEIIELTTSSSANASHKNQPYNGAGTTWYVEGAEQVLERTNAFAGWASNGMFYASGTGKTRFKVGSGGTIRISSSYGGMSWGDGGRWNPCIYTYQWNAAPTVKPGDGDGGDKDKEGATSTGMISLDPEDVEEEEGPITARLDTGTLTLRAGEISQIVHVHIANFRTRTDDRVEVIFPDKLDNWATLPGEIVVGGGDGSYWPPNMARPEHVDGFFFSAKSTAPTGKATVTIIVRQKKAGEVRLTLDVNVIGKGDATSGPSGPWSGKWETAQGPMELTQSGNSISGKFGIGSEYDISGKVAGNVFTFVCRSGPDKLAEGTMTIADDGKSITGFMVLVGDIERLDFSGRKKGSESSAPLLRRLISMR